MPTVWDQYYEARRQLDENPQPLFAGSRSMTPQQIQALQALWLLQLLVQNRRSPAASSVPTVSTGSIKAPLVRGLTVSSQSDLFGSVRVTLTFEEAGGPSLISHYNVYAKNMANSNAQPALVAAAAGSPIEFLVQADLAQNCAYVVQTVMRNGYSSSIAESPSTGGTFPAASIPGAPGAITTTMISDNAITTPKIATNAVTTVKLDATSIDVGGGGSKPGEFRVYDGSGTQIGFIGVESSNPGAWFKTLRVGGTGYTTAPFQASTTGEVSIRGSQGSLSVYNSSDVKIGFIGTEGSDHGAWFKTISIGGTSYSTGKLKADASGNVTLTDGSITATAGSDVVAINTTDAIKVTNSGAGRFVTLAASRLRVEHSSISTRYAQVDLAGIVNQYDASNYRAEFGAVSTDAFVLLYGSGGSLRVNLSASSNYGHLNLYDTAATLRITLDGSNGKLTSWNSSGAPRVTLDGGSGSSELVVSSATATSATAGSQTLPSNPVGFLSFTLGGSTIKIPYYGT